MCRCRCSELGHSASLSRVSPAWSSPVIAGPSTPGRGRREGVRWKSRIRASAAERRLTCGVPDPNRRSRGRRLSPGMSMDRLLARTRWSRVPPVRHAPRGGHVPRVLRRVRDGGGPGDRRGACVGRRRARTSMDRGRQRARLPARAHGARMAPGSARSWPAPRSRPGESRIRASVHARLPGNADAKLSVGSSAPHPAGQGRNHAHRAKLMAPAYALIHEHPRPTVATG